MLKINTFLAVFMFLFLLAGCAGSEKHERTEVEVYRKSAAVSADEGRMLELCRNLEQDAALPSPQRKTEVEIYRKDSAPGVSEYRREIRESNRYAGSDDKDRMLQLCRDFERDYRSRN